MRRVSLIRACSILFSLLLMISLAACTQAPGTQSIGYDSPRKLGGINYPIDLKDQAGNLIKIEKEPKRIVSLIPSDTEIAFALHLDKQMVGVTTNDNYPEQVKKLPKVGDFKINMEKVVSLKPDLVLASSVNGKETVDQLKKLGLTVLVLDAQSIKEVYKSIDLVGQATNHARESDQLVAQMEKTVRDVYAKVVSIPDHQKVKVWIEIDPTLYTAGEGTFLNELITLAGGKNVAVGLKGWPKVSEEQVVKWNPDVILTTYGGEQAIAERKGWSTINAVKNKRIYSLDPNLTSRPGPRIVEGFKEIATALYPEQFGVKK